MEDLRARINSNDLSNLETVEELLKDIMELEQEMEEQDILNELLDKVYDDIVKNTLEELNSVDYVSSSIDNLKTIFEENTDLDKIQVNELFESKDIKTSEIMEDVLEQADLEVGELEEELSEVIEQAQEQGMTAVEYLENEINKLEKEKSDKVKEYNELIEAIKEELEERDLILTEKDVEDKISRLRMEQEEIYKRSNGYPSDEEVERYHEINKLVEEIEKDYEYRKQFYDKSVDELNEELIKLDQEQENIYAGSNGYPSDEEVERYHEINKRVKYIEKELKRKEKIKFDKYTDEDLKSQIDKLNAEQEELYAASISSGEEMSEKDQKRYHEINDLVAELKKELQKRLDSKYSKLTNEEILDQIEKLQQEQEMLYNISISSGEEMSEKDQERYHEINDLVTGLKEELKKREEDITRTFGLKSIDELENLLEKYSNEQKQIQSIYDKRIEELHVKLRKAQRLEDLKEYIKNNGKTKKITNVEKRKDFAKKALIAVAGFGTGLALSSVPGIGVIRTVAATTKLVASGINIWTKKFPEGKVAKLINSTKDKLNEKFEPKIEEFKEKHPKIYNGVKTAKDKIKAILTNKKVNLFINGVSAGYVTGNLIELFTGKSIFEHFKPDKPVPPAPTPTPDPTPTPTPTPDVVGDTNFTLDPNATYDLSGIESGFVSSDATKSVDLMTEVADDLKFDRIVNGRAHFFQADGKGMAWYDLDELEEYLSKAVDVGTKTR